MVNQAEKILSEADKYLQEMRNALKEVRILPNADFTIHSSEFRTKEKFEARKMEMEKISTPLIYALEFAPQERLEKLLSSFKEFHTLNVKKTKNKDRVNVSRFNGGRSPVLYVGSSVKFYTRLTNHFGLSSVRTYGMHLSKWDNDLDYSIVLKTCSLTHLQGANIDQSLLELIEQRFWDNLQPVFGKKSGH